MRKPPHCLGTKTALTGAYERGINLLTSRIYFNNRAVRLLSHETL